MVKKISRFNKVGQLGQFLSIKNFVSCANTLSAHTKKFGKRTGLRWALFRESYPNETFQKGTQCHGHRAAISAGAIS